MYNFVARAGFLVLSFLLVGCEGENTSLSNQVIDIIPTTTVGKVSQTQNKVDGFITEAEAKQIALNHANVVETDATFVKVKFDYDDGVAEYEVEFYVGNTEYDYEINATTGEIRSYDQEIETPKNTGNVNNNANNTANTNTTITEAEAKQIALNHSNVVESDANFVKVKLDYDDGVAEYEVEFYVGNTEYDYEINATTGEIRSYDQEIETPKNTGTVNNNANNTANTNATITEAEAKQIALNHANVVESDANFVKVKLDYDYGVAEYEVEFYVGNTEYDYEINATTGEIRSYDQEIETPKNTGTVNNNANNTANTNTTITEAEAKQIALNHANVVESDANFVKVKLDYDDGVAEYEVEFKVGNMEYEYEIHANTGAILKHDKEIDD